VELPTPLGLNETTSVVFETIQTHASYPWPAEASQTDDQVLKYETDILILSPYNTAVQRTKIRSPSPRIKSYTENVDASSFTTDAPVTKSGATITYGPFNNVGESTNLAFANEKQRRVSVQYGYDHPSLGVRKLRRVAEVSHWGANLNTQDEIHLYNAGPKYVSPLIIF
jgi:oligosaccharyltransferase complex subunit alpha (ribophorin I)